MVFLLQYNMNGVPATEYIQVNQSAVKYIAGKILCSRTGSNGRWDDQHFVRLIRNVVRNGI